MAIQNLNIGDTGQQLVNKFNDNFESLIPIDSTGSEIVFDRPRTYGTDEVPINITTLTDNDTGAKKFIQKIYHNAASLAVPITWVKLNSSADYVPGVLNIIFVEYARAGRKEYVITQDS